MLILIVTTVGNMQKNADRTYSVYSPSSRRFVRDRSNGMEEGAGKVRLEGRGLSSSAAGGGGGTLADETINVNECGAFMKDMKQVCQLLTSTS